jgi:LacI family transcriptional regulator
MASTTKDIARHLGISQSTVSRALSETGSHLISPETRRRVEEAARELEYSPNAVARSLRRGRTDVIGFYSGYGSLDARIQFLSEIIGGLQIGCNAHRKHLLLHGDFAHRTAEQVHHELVSGQIDGLILLTPPQDFLVEQLAKSHLPAVALVDAVPQLPSVVADEAQGAQLLAQHLAARGHRHVMYRGAKHGSESTVRRETCFIEEAQRHGIQTTLTRAQTHDDLLSDEEKSLLAQTDKNRPTAAVCWQDYSAHLLLRYCRDNNIAVPQRLAVTGFNGFWQEAPTRWELTTIRAPWLQVAQRAVEILMQKIEGESAPLLTALPVELLPGNST